MHARPHEAPLQSLRTDRPGGSPPMPDRDDHHDRARLAALLFPSRILRMRMLGAALCALPIASVLAERGAPAWLWAALAVNALVWPQVAWMLSRRARDPVATEYRNLLVDAVAGGLWVAAIALSLLPTTVMATVLASDRLAAGGWRLFRRAAALFVLAFAAGWALAGFPFAPSTSTRTLLACLPLMFGYHIALSLVTYRLGRTIARQNRELERSSRTDSGSDLPNRRHFDIRVRDALSRFDHNGDPATLLMIDIDAFKSINDHYGHGVGDLVLRRVADVLRTAAGATDTPARIGGDEFAILLAPAGPARACAVAEYVRAGIAALSFDGHPTLACTASIGVSTTRPEFVSPADWLRDADGALYRAKAAGRNCVAVA
ncbi:diguanylate cyclase [Luteimonas sp. S4-F44]|uniref:sensor domain-containing diguanylate cyclase n=1 Tax=Luteimonas sp. S4-F44 TaxID=2925842 RepID=UPI001F52F127|nr:diguanylate cyclase [Luteimonas sp. S4-F44]UNK43586.1 diguanylate cyclase [Luteimonas sp. S4-F44]